jgi:hypothetical protein
MYCQKAVAQHSSYSVSAAVPLPGLSFKLLTFFSNFHLNFFSPTQKTQGCKKMVCWKCNTFFCWLCEERLNPQSPFLHFNNPASKCYNLLFHGVPLSDDEDDWWEAPGIFLENDGYD